MPVRLAHHEWAPPETDAGAAAPVAVLVHGITGWWRTWWRVGPALAGRGWRAVGIDLGGHGGSPPINGAATVQDMAGDVAGTLDGLGVEIVDVLIGHSLGAAVSMELASSSPALVRRAVLEDPPGQTRADDHEYQATLQREVLAARADPGAEVRRELADNPTWQEEDARQNVEGRARCDLAGILASLRSGTGVRPVDLAPSLRLPTLYLLADADRSALGSRRDELIRVAPASAEVVEFDCGHTIHRDRCDAYLATVLHWLERRS